MTTAPTPSAASPAGPTTDKSALRRHAFGWPPGSVRALLAFMVLIFLWLGALFFTGQEIPLIYVYLTYLMVLIIAHYFAARAVAGRAALAERSPLGLPAGTVRLVLVLGFAGLIIWLLVSKREFDYPKTGSLLPVGVLLSAFFAGTLTTRLARWLSGNPWAPSWVQDLQAWLALISVLGLAVLLLYHLFVRPSLTESREGMAEVEAIGASIFAGIVGFYFGARS